MCPVFVDVILRVLQPQECAIPPAAIKTGVGLSQRACVACTSGLKAREILQGAWYIRQVVVRPMVR